MGSTSRAGNSLPESADMPYNVYAADIYEYVSFMGDIHHQLHDVGDGGKVRLRVEPRTKPRNRLDD